MTELLKPLPLMHRHGILLGMSRPVSSDDLAVLLIDVIVQIRLLRV